MSFAPEPLCYEAAATPRALFKYMLAAKVPKVKRLGISFVKPSVYFSPIAQQTSKRPATTKTIQDQVVVMILLTTILHQLKFSL